MASDLSAVGQHFIVGLHGTTLATEEAELLKQLRPAGIILFAHNIEVKSPDWVDTLWQLISNARQAIGRDELLISIDHEGGRVHRLCAPVTHFPAANVWGENARNVAFAMGRELRALGVNLSFAPVLDILSEVKNTVVGDRAFSTVPLEVANAGVAYHQGLAEAGVLSCGKHFPGHGATVLDSHINLPVLDVPLSELRARELIPFQALISEGIPLIMTAHVLYPQIDPTLPSTLSPTIINGLLRGELGYSSAVVSDALEMGALTGFSPERVATQAMQAGVDLLLVAKPQEQPPAVPALRMAAALANASGIPVDILATSQQRIQQLFYQLDRLQRGTAPAARADLGCLTHRELESTLRVV